MSKEQINLSDALDLISQSKGEIKTSVQGKGGTIGEDLTQYAESIDNIQFRTIRYGNDEISLFRYGDQADFVVKQYLDGVLSFPDNVDITTTDDFYTMSQSNDNDGIYVSVTPLDYGTNGTIEIEDATGNAKYYIEVNVPALNLEIQTSSFEGVIPVDGWDGTGDYPLAWDETVASGQYIKYSISEQDGHFLDPDDFDFTLSGTLITNELVTTNIVKSQVDNTVDVYISPVDGYPIGTLYVQASDGTSTAVCGVEFVSGSLLPAYPDCGFNRFDALPKAINVNVSINTNTNEVVADENTWIVNVMGRDNNLVGSEFEPVLASSLNYQIRPMAFTSGNITATDLEGQYGHATLNYNEDTVTIEFNWDEVPISKLSEKIGTYARLAIWFGDDNYENGYININANITDVTQS